MVKGKDRENGKNIETEMIIHWAENNQEIEEVIEIIMETEVRIEVPITVTIEIPVTIEIAEITGATTEKNDSEMIVKLYFKNSQ
jgi:hypothetical protein